MREEVRPVVVVDGHDRDHVGMLEHDPVGVDGTHHELFVRSGHVVAGHAKGQRQARLADRELAPAVGDVLLDPVDADAHSLPRHVSVPVRLVVERHVDVDVPVRVTLLDVHPRRPRTRDVAVVDRRRRDRPHDVRAAHVDEVQLQRLRRLLDVVHQHLELSDELPVLGAGGERDRRLDVVLAGDRRAVPQLHRPADPVPHRPVEQQLDVGDPGLLVHHHVEDLEEGQLVDVVRGRGRSDQRQHRQQNHDGRDSPALHPDHPHASPSTRTAGPYDGTPHVREMHDHAGRHGSPTATPTAHRRGDRPRCSRARDGARVTGSV